MLMLWLLFTSLAYVLTFCWPVVLALFLFRLAILPGELLARRAKTQHQI